METWIQRMCRDVSRRQVIAWASVFLAGALVIAFNARYVKNFVVGPYAVQAADLAQITDAEKTPHYFISTTGDKVVDTGVQEITTTTRDGMKEGSAVSSGYYGVLIGDRFLIVKSATKPMARVEGELKSFPADLSNQLFSGTDGQEIQSRCYPFYLESQGFRDAGYWGIGIGVVFLAIFLKFGRTAWTRLRDVNQHPVVRRVQQWGDPIGTSMEAEREAGSAVHYKSMGILITDNFVIQKAFFAFNVLRFNDLVWAYKKVTKKSVNFVPTGKDYDAVMIFYGGTQNFRAKEKIVGEVLVFAAERAPWAVIGFSKDIETLYSKHQAEFCQAVEGRRRDLISKKV